MTQKMQFLILMGRISSFDVPLKLATKIRSFKEKPASKKEGQQLEKALKGKRSQQKGSSYQKLENTSNQYFLNKILKRKQKPAIREILPKAWKKEKNEDTWQFLYIARFSITSMNLFREQASKTRKYVETLCIAPFYGGAPTF